MNIIRKHKAKFCIDARRLTRTATHQIKESKGAKIGNRYNQVPHLTQDTKWESDKLTVDTTNESQEVSPFPAGDHKTHINRRAQRHSKHMTELEDLKVLRRSPDLLNNVKIGQGQLQLIMEQILFYYIWGLQTFWSSDLNNLMNNPSNSPVISEKQIFRWVCGSPNE